MKASRLLAVIGLSLLPTDRAWSDEPVHKRVTQGLLVLYDFASSTGPIVKDRATNGRPLDLRITEPTAVKRATGELEVKRDVLVCSDTPATKITTAVRHSREISIETWIRPRRIDQSGPARIVTLSSNATHRNMTLGQEGDRFDLRLRSTTSNDNGIPSLSTAHDSVATDWIHVVGTFGRGGRTRMYVNGELSAERNSGSELDEWDDTYHLSLANEQKAQRPWLGTFRLVAIYGRRLSQAEVMQNFRARLRPTGTDVPPGRGHDQRANHFASQVAPILAEHCLECHDAATKKGDLDLAHKSSALSGGDSGVAIVPGESTSSLLWELIESDAMPADRPSLSTSEKQIIRAWIDEGAIWPIDYIDPAVYVHATGAQDSWVRRLTVPEYIATVRSAVGVDISREARQSLPRDLRADGFSNTAYNLTVDLEHIRAYAQLAETIVGRMDVPRFAARFSQRRKVNDNDMRDLIAEMGKHLLRGSLNDYEVNAYRGVSTTVVSAGGDFDDAVAHVITAMLQAPRFLYRIENQRGDGTLWPIDHFGLASRASYILWGAPPDKELINAGESGDLDRAGLERQVDRMLDDPRAIERSKQFVVEWLNLNRLSHLRPNAEKFPDWTPELAAAMRRETLEYFEEVVWRRSGRMSDLLNSQLTFATPALARHYRLRSDPSNATGADGFAEYDLQGEPARGGILTHGSVLTVGGDEASMVTRGLFVLHDLLRGVVKDPPPCVDTTPMPTQPGLTQRGIAENRIANASCSGCHSKFEPLAFGLERFDGLGTYRERDEFGNLLREDGQLLVPGEDSAVAYHTANELMDLLAESDRVRESITWKLAQFAVGRPLGANDAVSLQEIHAEAEQGGGTYRSLMRAIVLSDLVRMTRTEREHLE